MAAEHMETMPQTVPSALGFGSSLYDFSSVSFAADFDLSLLPSGADCEVPYSPQSQLHLLSLYCDQTSPMFPGALDDFYKPPAAADSPKLVKEEPYQSGGWEGSPIGSTYSSPHYCPPSPLSPDPAVARIKQEITLDLEEILQSPEYLENIYFSQEKTDQAGIRAQESKFLQDIFPREKKDNGIRAQEAEYQEGSIIRNILEREPVERKPQPDHRLLREVLKDTSFQKRYNLMPFEIGGVGPAFKSEVKMEACETDNGVPTAAKGEASASASGVCGVDIAQDGIEPMLSLAIEQLKEDLNHTCNVLGIATDPAQWTSEDAKGWLVFNLQQFGLPAAAVDRFHDMAGPQLTQLTEDEFQQRAPQGGSLLHAQLEIWKAACGGPPIGSPPIGSPPSALMMDTATQSSSSCGDASEDEEDEEMGMTGMMGMGGADSPPPPHLLASASAAASPSAGGAAKGQGGRGGSHIHLWQFLKELLASPQANGACIRWLDRTTGVFKIEDSVRVARLWGQRKNRPAMNYDKLSRSIRQYYKKGIMKKTERSQRLVYQFCHPYCL